MRGLARRWRAVFAVLGLAGLIAAVLSVTSAAGGEQRPAAVSGSRLRVGKPLTVKAARFDVSEPLDEIAAESFRDEQEMEGPELVHAALPLPFHPGAFRSGPTEDPVAQRAFGPGSAPSVGVSFEGIGQLTGFIPPDPNGEIGPHNYVEMTNAANGLGVFDRTGKVLLNVPNNAVFKGFGGPCEQQDDGDPIVVYDQLADRWLLSEFALPSFPNPPFFECIAISQTGDPTGAYYRYAFQFPAGIFGDYPKLSVWPDGYYMTVNEFAGADLAFVGAGAAALERDKMLAGDPNARMVYIDEGVDHGGQLPGDLDGTHLPPSGAPNPFVEFFSGLFGSPQDALGIFHFHVDWIDTSRSSFTLAATLPVAPFDPNLCNFDYCIPQKSSFATLDPLSDRLMFRAAYRNFGDHESIVVNHTVDVGGDHAGIRWYEVRNTTTGPILYQQGTFAPDDRHRWMGSIAMDANGNIALGYSLGGKDLDAGIAYTGRLASDPLGQMTQGEGIVIAGSGAQTHPLGRWGDYTDMTVDPLDDCTFWYANEYYGTTSIRGWSTRIASFTFPSCDAQAPTAVVKPAKAKVGKRVTLRYVVSDNKGETAEQVTILRPNGRPFKKFSTGFATATQTTRTRTITAPGVPGRYQVCVNATDRAGNSSGQQCGTLTVNV